MNHRVPTFTKANTLTAEEAGELMLESSARLLASGAHLIAWRVAGAVWSLTVPYSKGWEAVFVDRLAALTGMDERSVRRGIKECAKAGALQWEPNRWIPPKGQPGRPSLIGLPDAPKRASMRRKTGANHPGHGQNQPGLTEPKTGANHPDSLAIGAEFISHESTLDIDTGEHRSSGIGHRAPDRSSEDWEAERHARPEARPGPEPYDTGDLAAAIEAALDAPGADDRFAPFHADGRTGDTTGESEAELTRWAGANPAKARQRRMRGE